MAGNMASAIQLQKTSNNKIERTQAANAPSTWGSLASRCNDQPQAGNGLTQKDQVAQDFLAAFRLHWNLAYFTHDTNAARSHVGNDSAVCYKIGTVVVSCARSGLSIICSCSTNFRKVMVHFLFCGSLEIRSRSRSKVLGSLCSSANPLWSR